MPSQKLNLPSPASQPMSLKIISGSLRGKTLTTPSHSLRPTSSKVRGAIFNSIAPYLEEAAFLDLCAGSGAMGFEALSRGSKHATFVDSHPSAIAALKKNVASLDLAEQTTIVRSDAYTFLSKTTKIFDIIFVDPPYDSNLGARLIEQIDQGNFLTPCALVLLESPKPLPTTSHLKLKKEKIYGNTSVYILTNES